MDFQSNNLTIPRGKAIFAKFLPGTQTPGPFRELGNCPEFTLTRETESISHYSSQSGLRVKDAEHAIESTLNGAYTTDDFKTENLAHWFGGDVTTVTATSQTGVIETFNAVKAGDIFQLGRSNARPTGYRKVASVVINDVDTPATVYVAGTDYVLDADLGIFDIVAGGAAVGKNIKATYNVTASSREQIAAGESFVEGELKFISYNPVGPQGDTVIPRARLTPSGDLALLFDPETNEYGSLSMAISALKKGSLALAYRDGRAVAS